MVAENLEEYGILIAFMDPKTVRNVSDYIESHGVSKAFIAEKIGLFPQALGQSLMGKRKMKFTEYLKICEVLEKDPGFFTEAGGRE